MFRRLLAVTGIARGGTAHVLPSSPLPYRGVLVDVAADPALGDAFSDVIGQSLEAWTAQGLNSVMLRVPIDQSALCSVAAGHGFEFHHASGGQAVLKRWLRSDLEDKVPPWATHQVGGAGFVLSEQGELLVVKEWRNGPDGERIASEQWKLPGGLLDRGESFEQGVAREVLEETGVASNFESILAFWHRHKCGWGKSDLYFVARLTPTSRDLTPCPDEISDCRWMPLDEFISTQDHPLILQVCDRVLGLRTGSVAAPAGTAPAPLAEMLPGGVQWPGRDPYPTYFACRR